MSAQTPPPHNDVHGDSPHVDDIIEHLDVHLDTPAPPHTDHSDHTDVPHSDTPHTDAPHTDTPPHADAPHGDLGPRRLGIEASQRDASIEAARAHGAVRDVGLSAAAPPKDVHGSHVGEG